MTIFDNIKNLFKKQLKGYADVLVGGTPSFSLFGNDIYRSDSVQQAVSCIVSEISKLEPTHVRKISNETITPQRSFIQNILDNPNRTMTTAEFLEKVTWNYFLNYNSFIVPTYYTWTDEQGVERRVFESLNPIRPNSVTFLEDAKGEYYCKFEFDNNKKYTFPYKDIIHIKRNFSINEFMGGDENGNADNRPLLKTLQTNADLLDGLAKALKVSTKINGILKINTMLENDKLKASREKFVKQLENNEDGILSTDLKNEYQPLNRNIKIVDATTLQFIDEKILRSFGVPRCILTGDYTKDQYEAFYQKTIEPLAIRLSQAFTKAIFTQREKGYGNKIVFYPKELIFMSTAQTLEMINLLGASGTITENEKRIALGMQPLQELEGKRMQSLNYVDVKDASKYQVGTPTKEEPDESDEEDIEPTGTESKAKQFVKNEVMKRSIKKMDKIFENRQYDFEIREDETKSDEKIKIIEGRPIVFDSRTDISGMFEEVIEKGALDKTDLKDVRFMVNHDTNQLPLARSRNNNENSTMQLKKDDKGLSVRVKLDMNNPRAVELYSAVKRGDVSGMSFMFQVDDEDVDGDEHYPTRHIKSISKVMEVSAVTFPAYDDTEIQARSKTLDSVKARLESRKKSSDDELELEKLKIKFGTKGA